MTKEQADMIAEAVNQYDGWYTKVVQKDDGWEPEGLHVSGARFDIRDFVHHAHEGLEGFLKKEVQWMIDSTKFMRKHKIHL